MTHSVKVIGVGMIPFTKPGQSDTYDIMGEKAARLALADAGIEYKDIGQVLPAISMPTLAPDRRRCIHLGSVACRFSM